MGAIGQGSNLGGLSIIGDDKNRGRFSSGAGISELQIGVINPLTIGASGERRANSKVRITTCTKIGMIELQPNLEALAANGSSAMNPALQFGRRKSTRLDTPAKGANLNTSALNDCEVTRVVDHRDGQF